MTRLAGLLQAHGALVAFAALFLISALRQPEVFLQPENLRNLLNQNAAVGMIAVGMTLVIATGGIDLSVGSLMALAAALAVVALNRAAGGGAGESGAVLAAAGAAVGAGLLLGALNGFLVAYGRVAPFIATLVGLAAYRSLCLAMASGGEIRSASAELFPSLGRGGVPLPFLAPEGGRPLEVTWGILLFLAVALAAGFAMNRTRFGRYATAVGANPRAAHYSAVNTGATKFWAYTALGLCTGLAALFSAARMNSVATSTLGLYYELDAIAAVVIGGTSLSGGAARVWGTVVGVLLLGLITNMLVVSGVSVYWQGVVKGAIILFAVLLQRNREAP